VKKCDKLNTLSRHKERSYRETAGNRPKSLVLIVLKKLTFIRCFACYVGAK